MSRAQQPIAVRLYATALRLFPSEIREEDGHQMVSTFGDLWENAQRTGGRARLLMRAFGRLPWVAAAEWLEILGVDRG